MRREDIVSQKAKEHQQEGGGSGPSGRQKSDKPIDTKKELAKLAGTSHDTIMRIEYIQKKAEQEQGVVVVWFGSKQAAAAEQPGCFVLLLRPCIFMKKNQKNA